MDQENADEKEAGECLDTLEMETEKTMLITQGGDSEKPDEYQGREHSTS